MALGTSTPEPTLRLADRLSADRVSVDGPDRRLRDKGDLLGELAALLAPAVGRDAEQVRALLADREALQSTGIGEGVAVPHAFVDGASSQVAALVVCPAGVGFDAIDGEPVTIAFGVVGPRRAGEHLRVLARISRLLRDAETRERLLAAGGAIEVHRIVEQQDALLR